jgi:hypothetical protein
MTNNTEALREEFEGEFAVPDRIFFDQISGKYIGNYAYCKSLDELAALYNLQFDAYRAAHASQQKVIDSLRAENERLLVNLFNDSVISVGIDKLTERGELTVDHNDLIQCLTAIVESAKSCK